jgi:hypothetical protein
MNVFFLHPTRLIFCGVFAFIPATLYAQNKATAPTPTPGPRSTPAVTPKFTDQQMQEMISKLQERIHKAADVVLGRIQKEEAGVRLRFAYLRKPERLDPNSYGSKEDIALWRNSVQQLRDQENSLDKLYAEADQDLGNALIQQQVNQAIAEQIKNELLKSFPWSVIRKKSELMREYVAEHDELLTFYDKNWGAWKPGPQPGTATFSDQKLAVAFQDLKQKIDGTGQQIEEQYQVMMQ